MRMLLIFQLVTVMLVGVILGILGEWSSISAMIYGALLGIVNTFLTKRGADRALLTAVENPTHGIVAMYSGFAMRYAVALLGLLAGFRLLHLAAEPMIGGFILTIVIQALGSTMTQPKENTRDA